MKITRISTPMYKVGRYTLNEYEVRQLQIDFKEGKFTEEVAVYDVIYGTYHIINLDGRFD